MEPEFWHTRWQQQQIGFHQAAINPWLRQYWPTLHVPSGGTVLVPLCGKSSDMLWLAEQGHTVVGCELSPLAVEAFFAEHGLIPTQSTGAHGAWYRADPFHLWCGNWFDLHQETLPPIAAAYDRASLIALPPAMRPAYMQQLATLCSPGTPVLLISLEYAGAMQGPPFSIPETEIARLCAPWFTLRALGTGSASADAGRLQERGAFDIYERSHQLQRLPI